MGENRKISSDNEVDVNIKVYAIRKRTCSAVEDDSSTRVVQETDEEILDVVGGVIPPLPQYEEEQHEDLDENYNSNELVPEYSDDEDVDLDEEEGIFHKHFNTPWSGDYVIPLQTPLVHSHGQ